MPFAARATQRARALEEPATATATGVNRRMLASLGGRERQRFLAVMRDIIDAARPR